MPNWARPLSFCLLLSLALWSASCLADIGGAVVQIRHAELIHKAGGYDVDAVIDYPLSPTAKEALHKGVPLTWVVAINIRRSDWLWNWVIYKKKLRYTLQFHALLKQYEVKSPTGRLEMFLTLNAALNFMSTIHETTQINDSLFKAGRDYTLAIKTRFNRESLPIPLRPVAYLDAQWFLSSDWFLWPIPK